MPSITVLQPLRFDAAGQPASGRRRSQSPSTGVPYPQLNALQVARRSCGIAKSIGSPAMRNRVRAMGSHFRAASKRLAPPPLAEPPVGNTMYSANADRATRVARMR